MDKHGVLKAKKPLDPPVFCTAQARGLQPKIPISRLKLEHTFEEDNLIQIFQAV